MLVADPAQRMGMDEIKLNQWFLAGLPPGALEMNDHLISSCSMLDEVRGRPAAVSLCHQAVICRQGCSWGCCRCIAMSSAAAG